MEIQNSTSPTSVDLLTSPLTEAEPQSLNELMARDPLDLAKQDIKRIVQALREQRVIWEQNDKAKATKAPAVKKKLTTAEATALLDNLELDI